MTVFYTTTLGSTQDYLESQLQRCHVAICPTVMGSGASRDTQPDERRWDAFVGPPRGNAVRATLVPRLARSALRFRAQQHESVLDAFFEDLIGELLVGQGAGELQRPDHHGEDAECLDAGRPRIVGC